MKNTIRSIFFIVFCCLFAVTANPQDERLTIDWIFSDEAKSIGATPRYTWLTDDLVAIYDNRKAKAERTLEVIDASNGRRRDLVDAKDVIAGMTEILEPEEPLEELGWPSAFDASGRWALYEKSGDLLLVDLRRSTVSRIAESDAEESSARFSPNSEWIAFIRENDLYAWHIESGDETRLTTGATETLMNGTVSWVYWEELLGRVDQGYFWSPDSSSIAYLQTDDSGVGEMHYVDFEPNLPRVIKQRHPKPGEANPKVRAGVVSLEDGSTTWMDLGSYPYEYLARIKWLPDSKRLALQTLDRPQTTLDLFIANTETGASQHVMRETDPGWVNVHDDLYFLGDGERFVWQSERSGHAHLYMFSMDGELLHEVTSGEWALRPSGGRAGLDQAVSHIDEANEMIYFTALKKATTERHLYRVKFDGSDMTRMSSEDGVHSILFQPEGAYYLDRHSSLEQPNQLSVHSVDGDDVEIIAPADSTVADRFELRPWEIFSVKARDGFEMPAMMLKPRFFDASRHYPAIVYVYGGPSAPTVANAWQAGSRGYYHQLLADSGVVIFYVDNRSAAGKSKIDANTIVKQLYGPVELDDLLDGVAWLKSQPFIDGDKVGLWGWSGGGAMTLQAMTGSTEFAAGASVAPVSDWRFYDTIYTERYMKRPQDNEEGYESTSRAKTAENLHGRLLLVHGTYDDNVHPQNSWAFSDGLIEAGITFDMMIYPMRKHGISDDAAQLHVFKTMLEFWQENLNLGD